MGNFFDFPRIPKIGIVGWSTGDNSFGASKTYLNFLDMFGNVRILTPRMDIDEDLDLLIMPGGRDILPTTYMQAPGYFNTDPDQFKEHFMKINLSQYIDAGIPIFGICLGFQMICVHFGASLIQHINMAVHKHSSDEWRGEPVNALTFTNKFLPLERKVAPIGKDGKKKSKVSVCSLHHQGIHTDAVPDCLDVIAYTKEDNITEFICHKTLPIAGCQEHPEEDFCELSIELIGRLIRRSPNFKNEHNPNVPAAEGENLAVA